MGEYTGSGMYLAFKGTSLAVDYREFADSEEVALAEGSAGADVARTYLKTLEDGTATLSMVDQTGGTAATAPWNLMDKGAEGTLEWGPEGTATGKPRHYVNAIVVSRERTFPYDNVVESTYGFQFSGVVTDTAY